MEDRRADFEKVTMPHLDSVYAFAVLLAQDVHKAQDLVQETYLRAFRFFEQYHAGTNCKAWLFKILKNLFINQYHQRAREICLSDLEVEGEEDSHVSPPALLRFDTLTGKGIFRRDLERALEALPERLRAVVMLRDLEGFDYREIAEIIGCPIGTVMSRLSRARNRLKIALRDYRPAARRLVERDAAQG